MENTQWKIRHLLFSEQKQELDIDGQIVKLESMASQVLDYFCQHPDRVISRDELIEQVWAGQVITDNAVNRVIARLRKVLNDDAKNSEYIVTVPKKGYRFIAPVEEVVKPETPTAKAEQISHNSLPSSDASATTASRNKRFVPLLVLALVAIYVIYSLIQGFKTEQTNEQSNEQLTIYPLTRDTGAEHSPALSPDENWLVYSRFDQGVLNMYLKDVQSGQQQRISEGKGNSGAPSWSNDGKSLVYLYTEQGVCQYRIREFEQGRFINDKAVYNCPVSSFGQAIFNHNDDQLIFAQRERNDGPYFIYLLDLKSGDVFKPKQPEAYLGGHSEFDLHPTQQRLLVSSPDELQQISVFDLDLETDSYTRLFQKAGYLCCAVWGHKGQSVVMMGPYPATQIEQYDLAGNKINTLVTSSQTLGPPKRVANGKDYLFTGAQHNVALVKVASDGEVQPLNISSVEEYLPTMAADQETLAFISSQSGQEQVWLMDMSNDSKTLISRFEDNQKFFDLRWSPSQDSIALLKINGVRLLNIASQTFRDLPLPKAEIRGMSWMNDTTLAFSLHTDSGWRVHHYDLHSDTLRRIPHDWQFARYQPEADAIISFNLKGQLHLNGQLITTALRPPLGRDRRFSFELFEGALYFQQREKGMSKLYVDDLTSTEPALLFEHPLMFAFTAFENGQIVSVLDSSEQDVLRTRSQ